jgi:hypothetical protein
LDGATGFDMVGFGNSRVLEETEPHAPTRYPLS